MWQIMRDPVIAADGHVYERAAIQRCIDSHSMRSARTLYVASDCCAAGQGPLSRLWGVGVWVRSGGGQEVQGGSLRAAAPAPYPLGMRHDCLSTVGVGGGSSPLTRQPLGTLLTPSHAHKTLCRLYSEVVHPP